MAHKKGAGSTNNGRESHSKRLGIKLFGGQAAIAGNIIVRQRGTKHHPGKNVGVGVDHTLYALADGVVVFRKQRGARSYVNVLPAEDVNAFAQITAKKVAPKAKVMAGTTLKPEAPAKAKKTTENGDDLSKVEGIGPKIAEHFNAAGIHTFAELAATSVERLQEILTEAGPAYASHNPGTWPKQAEMAAAGKWDELKAWQDELDGGK